MFTAPLFQTPDMIEQHNLLGLVAALVDQGVVKTTLSKVVPELTPATLAQAHAEVEAAHGGQTGDRHEPVRKLIPYG